MKSYEVAQPVQIIAQRLIRDFHKHLKTVRVEYLFVIEDAKKKQPKKDPPGDVKVITGLNAYLAADTDEPFGNPFFVVLINRRVWSKVEDERHREAIIDYYLCRCGFDEKSGAPKKLDFDVAAYKENVSRYGAWHTELKELLEAGNQYSLPLADVDIKLIPGRRGIKKSERATTR